MEKYQSYKQSGVDWIGDIPIGWDVIKGKYILKILTGNYPSEIIEDDDGKYFIKVDDLNSIEDNFYLSNPKLKIKDFGVNTLDEGIILFPKRGMTIFTNKVVITKSRSFIDPNLMGIKVFESFNKIFLFYLLTNRGLGDICDSSTIPQINNKHIYPLEFIKPPLCEQHQIVQFLDEKTELIDKIISTKERKITLLKEQRTTLINEVVTKGLNPNVKMKNSGVEWIGEIPEHWISLGFTKIIKIRHGYQFREYDFTDNGIKIVKITQLDKEGYLNLDNCSFIDEKRLDEFERILIEENDVLMCLTGGTIGKIIKVGKVDEPLVQNYRVGHFSPLNNNIINDYVFWFMSSSLTTSQMFSEIRETGQPNIGMEDFGKMKVILPPMSEQIEIVRHLEFKTKEIDDLVQLEQKKIDLLKEYRQSLISEVVTGKIKVTN